jgi:hypothetical protein
MVVTAFTALGTGIGFGAKLLHSRLFGANNNHRAALHHCSSHEMLANTCDQLVSTTNQTAKGVQEINERLAGWKGQVDTRINFLEKEQDRLEKKVSNL